jgi:Uma2 family endonuclease
MALQIARWQFTVADYHRMRETGILAEDDRVELIDGEVRAMSPISPSHAALVRRLNATLGKRLGDTAIVSVQDPVQLNDYSEPQPDLAVLRPDAGFYAEHHPVPEDILLVIEVAGSSVDYDRDEKIPRYAQAGIREAWLIDIAQGTVEQCTHPLAHGYGSKQTLKRGDVVRATTVAELALPVDQILG